MYAFYISGVGRQLEDMSRSHYVTVILQDNTDNSLR